jgi:hypothetical protein
MHLDVRIGDLRCKDGRWMKLGRDHVQWQAVALNRRLLL